MGTRYSSGQYSPKHKDKYIGNHTPKYRSSWELNFMMMCDNNPSILKWASESIRVPYVDPFTGKHTTYVPDFFIQYIDKKSVIHSEIVEIKPAKHAILESVGKNKLNKYNYIKNQAKWAACQAFCKANGLAFRIVTENELFHTGKTK